MIFLRWLLAAAILILLPVASLAQGTIPPSGQQNVDVNGRPLAGCLLSIFQAGTVATPQGIFSDPGLTIPLPNPLMCDQSGRLPFFYLASGSVHARLTDSSGVVVYDYPSVLVVGPVGGGSGGGGSVDPTSVASTGDVKFRPTGETLAGWVKMNGQTLGSAGSGASGRANADTQSLFIYLWNNCPDAHCSVSGGRGATGLADFGANKTITLIDLRGRGVFGLDDMGSFAASRLAGATFTGGDSATTANGSGGEGAHTLTVAELASHSHGVVDAGHVHSVNDPGHTHQYLDNTIVSGTTLTQTSNSAAAADATRTTAGSGTGISIIGAVTGIGISNAGGGGKHNTMPPFLLGSWYQKL